VKDWFNGLQPRERLILGVGGAVAAIVVVWGLIWTPMRSSTVDLRDTVAEKTRLLTDLQRAAQLQPGVSGGTPSRGNQSLVVLVDSTGRSFGLAGAFTRTRPDGQDAISVTFAGAPFDALISWLIDLEQTYGIVVDSASMTGSGEPGLINGQLFLRRS
jgi:general secretion pathway protein M